jgi:signal peptidase II
MEKKRNLHIGWLVTAMVVVLLIIDQWIKLYIKTHFCLGESVRVTDWFFIDFIENNGMAWGMSFIGKFWLSLLRSVAIAAIIHVCHRQSQVIIIKNIRHLALRQDATWQRRLAG